MQFSRLVLSNVGTKSHLGVKVAVCGVRYRFGELKPKEKKEIKFRPVEDSSYIVESYKSDLDGMICSLGKVYKNRPENRVIEFSDSLISLRPVGPVLAPI